MEVWKSMPSTTPSRTHLSSSHPTHIRAELKAARPARPRKSLQPPATGLSNTRVLLNSRLLLIRDQFASLSMPVTTSLNTKVESSIPPDAEPNSITPSPLSDTEPKTARTTSSSETPGVQDGERVDTSECPPMLEEQVSAVSSWTPTTQ